jgi:hypothetical protein
MEFTSSTRCAAGQVSCPDAISHGIGGADVYSDCKQCQPVAKGQRRRFATVRFGLQRLIAFVIAIDARQRRNASRAPVPRAEKFSPPGALAG